MKFGIAPFFPNIARSRLFHKYAALLITVVTLSVVLTGVLHTWFSYNEMETLLLRAQGEQTKSAATRISQFVKEIEGQLAWTTQVPARSKTEEEWRFDAARLFRLAPPVTEIAQLDASGRELYRSSRQASDVIGSMADLSREPAFIGASERKFYNGPVYFVRESEPYMTIAVAGTRADHGIIVAEVNLKFIWEVVSQIKVGEGGRIYVTDSEGRLIAHPDISLVLRKTDLTRLAHVQSARGFPAGAARNVSSIATNLDGQEVLITHTAIEPLGWLVFSEMPVQEAFAPLYDRLIRSSLLLAAGFVFAVSGGLFFARRMVVPIRILTDGAKRLGGGDLSQRIAIATGDELEELGNQFSQMAAQLQESYSTLERKVEERTRQLEVATEAKSRFLATASHDLRQPLHALGLFVAQLRGRISADERKRVIERIETALSAMNELFNALLDITKLDAGILTPTLKEFPVGELLGRVETTFTEAAREKGLSLRIVRNDAWIRSDFILMERIISNLVSNAIRYTSTGRVLVGCRRSGQQLQLQVWDTGPGIPADQRQSIFGEFYRIKSAATPPGGFGLGLAIVDRLGRLLNHPIYVISTVGKGSCFSIAVPAVPAGTQTKSSTAARPRLSLSDGKLVVVIDDDPLVLEGMSGLIRSWGCHVVTGETGSIVLRRLTEHAQRPDLIISDYHLGDGRTGIDAINQLRQALDAPIPAFLMSGDIDAEPLRVARAKGYSLLHKPVEPMALRATLTRIVAQ